MFEAEFLPQGKQMLLIDLNAGRTTESPWRFAPVSILVTLAYLEASGRMDRVAQEVHAFQQRPFVPLAWCNHLQLGALLAGQWLSGGSLARRFAHTSVGLGRIAAT